MRCTPYDGLIRIILITITINNYVTGYSDLRAIPCMSPHLANKIPMTRSKWSGVITMRIDCEPGYDLPHNAPSKYECVPDRSPWKPSVIPDCTKEMIPDWVNVVAMLNVPPGECSQNSHKYRKEAVQGKLKGLCKNVFTQCSVRNVTSFCNGPPKKPSVDTDYWAQEIGLEDVSFVQIVLRVLYDKRHHYTFYLKQRANLVQRLAIAINGDAKAVAQTRLKAECPRGAIPVGRKADGKIACRGCPLGHYMDYTKKKCLMCPGGYYQDEQLGDSCKTCPAMRTLEDKRIWSEIERRVPKGGYSLSFCPTLKVRPDGSLLLVMPAREIGYKDYPEDPIRTNKPSTTGSKHRKRP